MPLDSNTIDGYLEFEPCMLLGALGFKCVGPLGANIIEEYLELEMRMLPGAFVFKHNGKRSQARTVHLTLAPWFQLL